MKAAVILPALLLAAFLQAAFPAAAWLGMAKAPFLLSVSLYYALMHGRAAMTLAALAGGLLQDSLGFMPLGVASLGFLLAGLGVQALKPVVFRESLLTLTVLTAAGAAGLTLLAYGLLTWGAFDGVPALEAPVWAVGLKAAGGAGLALAAAPAAFALGRALDALTGYAPEGRAP